MGAGGEPTVSRVADDAYVLRLVHPQQFNASAPAGARLQPSALQTKEFKPPERPSLYVEDLASFDDIVAAEARFANRGVIRVQVSVLRQRGLDVELSPNECDIPALRHAHASLCHVNKTNRDEIVEMLDAYVVKQPT